MNNASVEEIRAFNDRHELAQMVASGPPKASAGVDYLSRLCGVCFLPCRQRCRQLHYDKVRDLRGKHLLVPRRSSSWIKSTVSLSMSAGAPRDLRHRASVYRYVCARSPSMDPKFPDRSTRHIPHVESWASSPWASYTAEISMRMILLQHLADNTALFDIFCSGEDPP